MYNSKTDAFERMHPACNFIYLLIELALLVCVSHPVVRLIGLLGGVMYCIYQMRSAAIKLVGTAIPFACVIALINPLFSHQGVTVLTYLPSGNALTLESVFYGLNMGLMVLAVVVWFSIWSRVMRTDKWIQLMGKTMPQVALFFSMVLGFLPKLKRQYHEYVYLNRNCTPFHKFSMLMTWGLENSVDTADSMAARGYGLNRKRSYYTMQPIRGMEIFFLVVCLFLGIVFFVCLFLGKVDYLFYPEIQFLGDQQVFISFAIVYGLYSLFPLMICIKEDLKWKYLQSKI